MFKNLLIQSLECREKNYLASCAKKEKFPFFKSRIYNNENILVHNNKYNLCINSKYGKYKRTNIYLMNYKGFISVVDKYVDYKKESPSEEEKHYKEGKINIKNNMNSIEKILDETNSMIYINDICLKMDQNLLKCQNYEDVLSILITHRGALFLQNLITAIRMLSGFVIEQKKENLEKDKLNMVSDYTKKYTTEENEMDKNIRYDISDYKDNHMIDNNNNEDISYNNNEDISYNNNKDISYNNNKDISYNNNKDISYNNNHDISYNNNKDISYNNNKDISYNNNHDISLNNNHDIPYNYTGIEKIENNLIERYKNIFDILNNKVLVESEMNTQGKKRKLEDIIVLDERFHLLIDDIYKNRKHFDVLSICHILISLKELNYKHFLLFNSFVNPLKNFDIYIKEQFSNNQNFSFICSTIQLLLECFNTYIWAGYYNLNIYNKLMNSILLNKFIYINKNTIYTQHYDQLKNYTYMNYEYNINYPMAIKDVLHFFDINEDFYYIGHVKKNNDNAYDSINELYTCDKNQSEENKNNMNNIIYQNNYEKAIGLNKNNIDNDINNDINNGDIINKKESVLNMDYIKGSKSIFYSLCPIFLSLELFLKSIEIYKSIYVYNSLFFMIAEKMVYYYTQYLSPSCISMICEAFSRHRIFSIEHDRLFCHISKLVENNFEKFSLEHLYIILSSFKKMNLFFEKCIILVCKKFKKHFSSCYIRRQESILSLNEISILMESITFFNFQNKYIDEFIVSCVNYLEDYIDDIEEETSINISYALILSNMVDINPYFFSFIWRKIGKTTYWEKRKTQICLLWLSHMIQFKWLEYDLPKFCVLECLKVFYLKRKEKKFSNSKIIQNISKILNNMNIEHDIYVDIYGPYILDILIKNTRNVLMLTQDTTRNEINKDLGDFKIILNHLKLFGYKAKPINTKYFDSLSDEMKENYIKDVLMNF
ncbi:putative SNARE protein [Plasmodium gaboni]|uniref:Putative SNARE protein n=1 Tax=Plasmodium gaboni TaxID=647221 RepID=A0A151LB22_9APIC|nr:putative SNARE protein [Plasmodium gaboni]KYN96153.1 putative SNARE protein [Plasmodium gaboni]